MSLGLFACSSTKAPEVRQINGRVSPTYDGPPELDYCSTTTVYASPATISGTATYQARQIVATGPAAGQGLRGAGAAQPIRYAEVRVVNSSGQVVQCDETDATGNFSFNLPTGNDTFTVFCKLTRG